MSANWFGLEPPYSEYGKAKIIIIPAPYDKTASWKKGAAKGPEAIREASPYIELYDSITGREVFLEGIHGLEPPEMPEDPWRAALVVKTRVVEVLETGRFPAVVGGEHSLTLGAVLAAKEAFPALSVLQLDAHTDLREEYEGTKFSHACVMRRVAELGLPFVQAGVRSMSKEEKEWLDREGRKPVSAREILGDSQWTSKIIAGLTRDVYLSLDLDVLDPAEMPATGTPEPGGLSYHHIVDLALALRDSGKNVVAVDMMEFMPLPGLHFPQFTAASLLYTMLAAFVP